VKVLTNILKIIFILVAVSVIFLYGTYYYGLYPVKKYLVSSDKIYSHAIQEIVWVANSGVGEIQQLRVSPAKLILNIPKVIMSSTHSDSVFGGSYLINSFTARNLLIGKQSEKQFDWHLSNMAASIWLSQKFSIEQSISTSLENAYFGDWPNIGLENASQFYYGVTSDSLNTHQIIRLIATLRMPSRTKPHCFKFEVNNRNEVTKMVSRLKENWPEKYRNYEYQEPPLADKLFPKCK